MSNAGSTHFLAPYRRITSSGQFIPEIDGLRFVAIFSVYLYHLAGDVLRHSPPHYGYPLPPGALVAFTQQLNFGVPLFFVISGFILGLPFATRVQQHRPLSLKRYFWRRVTRLELPYILSMLIFFALKVVGARGSAAALLPHLGFSLIYLHNLVYGTPSIISIVAWSLEVEIQFYLLAPLLSTVFLVPPRIRRPLLILICATLSIIAIFFTALPWVHLSLLGNAQYFFAGFLLVDLYIKRPQNITSPWMWDLGSLAGWGLLFGGIVAAPQLMFVIAPILVPYLYYAAFYGPVVNRIITNAWIATIGGMCYTIYLLHNYLIALFGFTTEVLGATLPFEVRLLIQLLVISPGVLIISGLYFRFIERPCMRPDWPQRLLRFVRDYKASAAAPATAAITEDNC